MDINLEEKASIVEIKHMILEITCKLANDQQYTKEKAVEELKKVIRRLDEEEINI